MSKPHVVILGAGPAGVGAAYKLSEEQRAAVTVLEQGEVVGGNAGSFELADQRLDYGSHRLHPSCDPAILADVRSFIGDDLLDRPRHGRIHLRDKWIHFPLKPHDLLLRLDPSFAIGTLRDMLGRLAPKEPAADTFAAVLHANLGTTICEQFYFPYAKKIWGREPSELSGIQARRRVSSGSFAKLIRKTLNQVPGLKPPGAGRFYYPKRGFGQISEAYAEAAQARGAEIMLGWRVTGLSQRGDDGWSVQAGRNGETREIGADYVWSTIPISILARLVDPPAPPEVLDAAKNIQYRSMLLIYLVLDVDRFTEYDAHYFPSADILITRLSETKNYADSEEPQNQTILCAELPCDFEDESWNLSEQELGERVAADLARCGLPLKRPPIGVHVRRLRQAYPIYLNGYEKPFGILDNWADNLPGVLTYGRQGLFAHDNTHHALSMAYAASDCLTDGGFDHDKWAAYRRVFETHVVED